MFVRLQLAALVTAGIYLVSASPLFPRASCSRGYIVEAGDTCDKISAAQNVSTFQLADVNKLVLDSNCSFLFPGKPLCLGLVGQDCTTVHVIASGDTCQSIINDAGVTFDILRLNNPNIDTGCTNIYPGEVLCTATTQVYP